MEITNEDISLAESILLQNGEHFDEERVAFIKNLDTIDLQAVPGSGKTTALLAKLLILEKYLPFEDGSAILVISHTNVAVDEIRNRIGKYCPKLFSYPNFVGTIQSFVDQFLAIPYGHNFLNIRFRWIDTELYQDVLYSKFQAIYWAKEYEKPGTLFYGRHIEECKKIAKSTGEDANELCEELIEKDVKRLYLDMSDSKIKMFYDPKTILADPKKKKYQGISKIIIEVLSAGILSYEYAYNLAEDYCRRFPLIVKLLRKRFSYVFVDEMQDMEQHQYDLLENLFYSDETVYQRVGDKNQAIYSGYISLEDIWIDRDRILTLKGSYRLPPEIAGVVDNFALNKSLTIEGRMTSQIQPCLIVYANDTIDRVLPTFTKLVQDKISQDVISTTNYPIKCVGWVGKEKDTGKITLKDYYSAYEGKSVYSKVIHRNILCYLKSWHMGKKQTHIINAIRKSILDAIIVVMRLEKITRENGKEYTIRTLYGFLKENHPEKYENIKLLIYRWSIEVYKGNHDETADEIRSYMPELLKILGGKIKKSKEFLNSTDVPDGYDKVENPNIPEITVYSCDETNLQVQVGTVHSAKGETHLATLYVETFYQGKYESENLMECFCGSQHSFSEDKNKDKRKKESIKIAYVGMSRPNHLLCVAIHIDRYETIKDRLSNWDVVSIPSESQHE